MRLSILRILFLLQGLSVVASASNSVVNLSHYDLVQPDFSAMKGDGILGVIHEATYPRFDIDSKYFERQQAATRAGLLWGAYHYGNASDPIRQADHFLSVVSNAWTQADPLSRPSRMLLVLDFEKNGHYPGGTMRVDQAVSFVERIRERTGQYPGLYSNEYNLARVLNMLKATNGQKAVLTSCWLWIANYHYEPRATAPWGHWALWQYCGDGKCGLPRSVYRTSVANVRKAELNRFRGTRTALEGFWQGRAWQPGGGKPRREAERSMTADMQVSRQAAESAQSETPR